MHFREYLMSKRSRRHFLQDSMLATAAAGVYAADARGRERLARGED